MALTSQSLYCGGDPQVPQAVAARATSSSWNLQCLRQCVMFSWVTAQLKHNPQTQSSYTAVPNASAMGLSPKIAEHFGCGLLGISCNLLYILPRNSALHPSGECVKSSVIIF